MARFEYFETVIGWNEAVVGNLPEYSKMVFGCIENGLNFGEIKKIKLKNKFEDANGVVLHWVDELGNNVKGNVKYWAVIPKIGVFKK